MQSSPPQLQKIMLSLPNKKHVTEFVLHVPRIGDYICYKNKIYKVFRVAHVIPEGKNQEHTTIVAVENTDI